MKIKNLNDMFLHTLKDINYAEAKILKSLPAMIKAADNAELKEALTAHKAETQGQIDRIKQVFAILGMKVSAVECAAINGILEEAKEMLEDTDGTEMADAGVIASGQAVEHYEMVRYRSLVMWAGILGLDEAVPLLQQSLNEERAADEKLMAFAAASQSPPANDTGKSTIKPSMKKTGKAS